MSFVCAILTVISCRTPCVAATFVRYKNAHDLAAKVLEDVKEAEARAPDK